MSCLMSEGPGSYRVPRHIKWRAATVSWLGQDQVSTEMVHSICFYCFLGVALKDTHAWEAMLSKEIPWELTLLFQGRAKLQGLVALCCFTCLPSAQVQSPEPILAQHRSWRNHLWMECWTMALGHENTIAFLPRSMRESLNIRWRISYVCRIFGD